MDVGCVLDRASEINELTFLRPEQLISLTNLRRLFTSPFDWKD